MPQGYAGADWTCPTCAVRHDTHFCPACGEQSASTDHLTLQGFARQLLAALTSVDSQLVRSFRTLLFKPGALTAGYRAGQRKQYLLPINLFLFANVLFFAVQSVASVKVFATPLDMHLHDQFWSPLAAYLLDIRLQAKGTALNDYTPVFNQAVALHAKTLIGLMVPVFALLLPLLFFRGRQPFVVHAVFALHTYSFILMMLCAVLAFFAVLTWLGFDPKSPVLDHVISVAELVLLFAYLFVSVRVVYGATGLPRILYAFTLTVIAAALLLAYRFFLFVFTIATT
jgi:hypothetical protein